MIFKGCAIRLVTPFSDTNEVDFDKLEKLLDKQLGLGAAAIIVGGNNGEFLTMSDEEISSLIDFVVKKVDKKIPVLAQTGFNDTRRSIILGIKAKQSGVDALIFEPPYYNIGNEKGILSHYRSLAMTCDLPCYIFSDSEHSGSNLPIGLLAKLAAIDNIVGIIETSNDIEHIARMISSLPSNFDIISANDSIALAALSLGIKSLASSLINIVPNQVLDMYRHFESGKIEYAREIQINNFALIDALKLEVNPIPVKTAMNMMGIDVGDFRLPIGTMHPDRAAQLATILMDNNIKSY